MPEKKNVSGGALPSWPAILAMMALFGGALLVEKPLQSRRSAEKDLAATFRQAGERAEARLWEDPFEVLSREFTARDKELTRRSEDFGRHYCRLLLQMQDDSAFGKPSAQSPLRQAARMFCQQKKAKGPDGYQDAGLKSRDAYSVEQEALEKIQGLEAIRSELWRGLPHSFPKEVLFAGVALRGGARDEMVEARRRSRIAFVSALQRRGYFARNEGDISYLFFPEDRHKAGVVTQFSRGLNPGVDLVPIPYEIFDRDDGIPSELAADYQKVVVLWLDQDRFGGRIHAELAKILEALSTPPRSDAASRPQPSREMLIELSDFVLIGPATSSALMEMLRRPGLPPGDDPRSLTSALETLAYLDLDGMRGVEKLPPLAANALDHHFGGTGSSAAERAAGFRRDCGRLLADASFRRQLAAQAELALRQFAVQATDSDPDFASSVLGDWLEQLQWSCAGIGYRDREPARPKALAANRYRKIFSRLQIFSPYATATPAIVNSFASGGFALPEMDAGASGVPHFVSTIADDGKVLFALQRELGYRHVDLKVADVALVAEMDSPYGRALTLTFQALALMGLSGGENQAYDPARLSEQLWVLERARANRQSIPRVQQEQIHRIHVFRYLRGLDGIASDKSAPAPEPAKDSSGKMLRGQIERAEGANLMDQIRSVGGQLLDCDRHLRKEGRRLRAIGILGTDFYDKQLSLQVLRSLFPDVVFFTTDLDARYLHRDDQAWNRNLLVGSSFGFQLVRELQEEVPAFRDAYATSTFLAGLLALGKCSVPNSEGCWVLASALNATERNEPLRIEPRVFEIGITRAYPFSFDIFPDALPLQPPLDPESLLPAWQCRVFSVMVAVLIVAIALSRRVRSYLGNYSIAVAFFIACFVVVDFLFRDEPADLLEGISVRGTEILRMLIVGLTLALFLFLRTRIWRAQQQICPHFAGSGIEPMEIGRGASIHLSQVFKEAREKEERETSADLDKAERAKARLQLDAAKARTREAAARIQAARAITAAEVDLAIDAAGPPEETIDSPYDAVTGERRVSAARAWSCYLALQDGPLPRFWPSRQISRVLALSLVSVGVLAFLAWSSPQVFPFPQVPVRGSLLWDKILRYSSLLCLTFACFWALDNVRLCVDLVHWLASGKTEWPDNYRNRRSAERRGLTIDLIGDHLDIRVIALLTEPVALTVLFPFALLSLYILSRASFFDYWTWPWIVSTIVVLLLACTLAAGIALQRAAVKARASALRILHVEKTCRTLTGEAARARCERLDRLIQEVEAEDRGAFGPWTSNPIIGAILLPFGGASAISLIDFLLRLGT